MTFDRNDYSNKYFEDEIKKNLNTSLLEFIT